jgi:hypothetical protein
MWEAAQPLHLSKKERELLGGFGRMGSTSQEIMLRIPIVLDSAEAGRTTAWRRNWAPVDRTVLRWRTSILSRPESRV